MSYFLREGGREREIREERGEGIGEGIGEERKENRGEIPSTEALSC